MFGYPILEYLANSSVLGSRSKMLFEFVVVAKSFLVQLKKRELAYSKWGIDE